MCAVRDHKSKMRKQKYRRNSMFLKSIPDFVDYEFIILQRANSHQFFFNFSILFFEGCIKWNAVLTLQAAFIASICIWMRLENYSPIYRIDISLQFITQCSLIEISQYALFIPSHVLGFYKARWLFFWLIANFLLNND